MSNKIDFNSLSPEQKKAVIHKLKEKKEQEELSKQNNASLEETNTNELKIEPELQEESELQEENSNKITEINLQEPLKEELQEENSNEEIICLDEDIESENIKKHLEKKKEKEELIAKKLEEQEMEKEGFIEKPSLEEEDIFDKKPIIGGMKTNNKPKKKIQDESWETLIAFEQEFKKRKKEQEAETKKRALEEKRKLNFILAGIVLGGITIVALVSFFGIDNSELFRNSKFFFSR